jgi:hypothetical protein
MTLEQANQIISWRAEGHTYRQIADLSATTWKDDYFDIPSTTMEGCHLVEAAIFVTEQREKAE